MDSILFLINKNKIYNIFNIFYFMDISLIVITNTIQKINNDAIIILNKNGGL